MKFLCICWPVAFKGSVAPQQRETSLLLPIKLHFKRPTKQLRTKQAKSCCHLSETYKLQANLRHCDLITQRFTNWAIPCLLGLTWQTENLRGAGHCRSGVGEDGASWKTNVSNRRPRQVPSGCSQKSGGVVSPFVYSRFYLRLLRGKSANCLWVIVKRVLKHNGPSRES